MPADRVENDWTTHATAPAHLDIRTCAHTHLLPYLSHRPERPTQTPGVIMSKQQTVTGTVLYTERHGHTVYGNPMMSIHLVLPEVDGVSEHATYRISNDASLVYGIDNPDYKAEPHTFALTRAGRISHVVR